MTNQNPESERFRPLSEINHPNLVGMQMLEVDDSQGFLTLVLIEGQDFLSYVRPAGELGGNRLRRLVFLLKGQLMKIASVFAVLLALIVTHPALGQEAESTFEEFQEFGQLVSGRWAGDITLIADWPGQEKKQGDKITGYSTYRFIADGKGIEWDDIGGTTTGRTLMTYDATTNLIKTFHVGSGGGNWQTVIWKKSATEWAWKLVGGGLVDGRKFSGEGVWLFQNGGKTHILRGRVLLDGEELPELHDIYTRVNQ